MYNNIVEKLTVTLVCDVPGGNTNGTSVATVNLIESLREKGHTVRVLCCDESMRGKDGYYVCPERRFGVFGGYVRHVGVTLASPDEQTIRAALCGADIAHCMLPFALSKTTLRIAHEMGIPVTAGFHCQAENFTSHLHLSHSRTAQRLTYRHFYNKFYRDVDCVHYPSQFIRDVFENATSPTKGIVISNGVGDEFFPHETARPEEAKGKFVILSTGRYSREKCQNLLIEAVGKSRHKKDIRLVLAGSGALDVKYKKLAERYGIDDIVMRFFGRKELIDLLGYTDLYVHAADAELEGIAVLEAIKSGLPIVVSDSVNGAPKLLARDGRNLFSSHSADDLANKIDYWIEHPAERKECAHYYATGNIAASKKECMDKMERMLMEVAEDFCCKS